MRTSGAFPGLLAAFKGKDVALRHRQEILDVLVGAEGDGTAHPERGIRVGEHQGCGTIRNQGTVGALQRPGDERVLLAFLAAEVEAEILAHLCIWIVDAILVVLGRDHGQRVGLVAITLEVSLGDLAEDTGETGRRVAVFRQV